MKFLSMLTLLFSLCAQSSTLRLGTEGEGYSFLLKLDGGEPSANEQRGEVEGTGMRNGRCYGNYTLNLAQGVLDIVFWPTRRGGGCTNEDLTIYISLADYERVLAGETMPVTFVSTLFYRGTRNSTLSLVER